jgi:hypothetical protein
MFINSQVGLLSSEKSANSAVLAVGLSQASGPASGIIQSTGAVFGGLIGAAVSALSEKHLAGRAAVWIFRGKSVVLAVCGAAAFVGLFRILAACGVDRPVDIGDSVSPVLAIVGYVHLLGNGKSPTFATGSG